MESNDKVKYVEDFILYSKSYKDKYVKEGLSYIKDDIDQISNAINLMIDDFHNKENYSLNKSDNISDIYKKMETLVNNVIHNDQINKHINYLFIISDVVEKCDKIANVNFYGNHDIDNKDIQPFLVNDYNSFKAKTLDFVKEGFISDYQNEIFVNISNDIAKKMQKSLNKKSTFFPLDSESNKNIFRKIINIVANIFLLIKITFVYNKITHNTVDAIKNYAELFNNTFKTIKDDKNNDKNKIDELCQKFESIYNDYIQKNNNIKHYKKGDSVTNEIDLKSILKSNLTEHGNDVLTKEAKHLSFQDQKTNSHVSDKLNETGILQDSEEEGQKALIDVVSESIEKNPKFETERKNWASSINSKNLEKKDTTQYR